MEIKCEVFELNDDEIRDFLKKWYLQLYTLNPSYKEPTAATLHEEIVELAKKRDPYAIFYSSCLGEKLNRLGASNDNPIIEIFGVKKFSIQRLWFVRKNKSKKPLHCWKEWLYDKDRQEEFKDWISGRASVILGGNYEETKSFVHIVNNVLPIATPDIWDTVYDLFCGENMCVKSEERKEISARYEEYKRNNPDFYKEPIITEKELKEKVPRKAQKTFEEYKDECKTALNNADEEYFVKALSKVKKPNMGSLYLAFNVLDAKCEISDNIKIKAGKVLSASDEDTIRSLVSKLSLNDSLIELRSFDKTIRPKFKSTDTMLEIYNEEFKRSLENEKIQSWIAFLNRSGLLERYKTDSDFWRKINSSFLDNIIDGFSGSLLPEEFIEFATGICVSFSKSKDEKDTDVYKHWENALIQKLIEYDKDRDKAMGVFRNFYDALCETPSDYKYLLEKLFELKRDISKKNNTFKKEPSVNYSEKLSTAIKPLEQIEEIVAKMLDGSNGQSTEATNLLEGIANLRKNIAYFALNVWNSNIDAICSNSDFIRRNVDFDGEKHLLESGTANIGEKVTLITMGLTIDGSVKYKARVIKED